MTKHGRFRRSVSPHVRTHGEGEVVKKENLTKPMVDRILIETYTKSEYSITIFFFTNVPVCLVLLSIISESSQSKE